MIKREEATRFVEQQLDWKTPAYDKKIVAMHYGLMELHKLLDYIYGGPPVTDAEKINAKGRGWR